MLKFKLVLHFWNIWPKNDSVRWAEHAPSMQFSLIGIDPVSSSEGLRGLIQFLEVDSYRAAALDRQVIGREVTAKQPLCLRGRAYEVALKRGSCKAGKCIWENSTGSTTTCGRDVPATQSLT